jgi:CRP/FNR family transcriptional regulator, cyclic AMP receptor protein
LTRWKNCNDFGLRAEALWFRSVFSTAVSKVKSATDNYRAFLETIPLFTGLLTTTLDDLAAHCRAVRIEKGEYLFFQEDAAHSIYVVRSGWIAILLHSTDGRELVLAEMRPGDVFGENALITGLPRSASALAHETTAALRIGGPAFLSALDREPLLSRRLLVLAARRLSEGNERERALAFLNAGARIARILLTFDEMDRQTADKGYITVSQDELAQRTGLTRQTVARFLGDWRRQDYLITGRGRIMLLQRRALQALLEEENII